MKVTTTANNLESVIKTIHSLTKKDVLVGIPGDKANRNGDTPITNAVLGYIHTVGGTVQVPERTVTLYRKMDKDGAFSGSSRFVKKDRSNYATVHTIPAHTVTLPPRPFLEPGIRKAQGQITDEMKKAAKAALAGKPVAMEKALHAAGLVAQSSAKDILSTGEGLTPLAPSTIASKKGSGRKDQPLIDTGQLQKSISYVIREK